MADVSKEACEQRVEEINRRKVMRGNIVAISFTSVVEIGLAYFITLTHQPLVVYLFLVLPLVAFIGRNRRPVKESGKKKMNKPDGYKPYKDVGIAYLLWFFLGVFGGHRFYIGKIGTGILYLLTLGLFGIGLFFDLFTLAGQVRKYNEKLNGGN